MTNTNSTIDIRAPPTTPPAINPMTWLLSSLAAGTAVGLPEEYGEGDSTREESNRKCDDDGDGDEVEGKGDSVAENDDCIVEGYRG